MKPSIDSIFLIKNAGDFDLLAYEVFKFQYRNNTVYQTFCNHLNKTPQYVKEVSNIPFLPIEFFKSKKIVSSTDAPKIVFESSGTTGTATSKHQVTDINIYEKSYLKGFQHFYGPIEDYCVLALLPSYLEREGSSLIYMVDDLISKSNHTDSGFYLHDVRALKEKLNQLESAGTKTLLIGVSFALLDLVEQFQFSLNNTIVMETGGMKGRRKELIRSELHEILKKGFGVAYIHSEYGMTELLSQAYSMGNGTFNCPPWMKIVTRDTENPLEIQKVEKTGGINIIDLANINSCSFIATQDLGKTYSDGSFEVLGRFDHSDIRGCNLMAL
ncbi:MULTISPECIES: LuxE/PaaK family acyltransferase [unclassified Croceitalea]|uniref:LuxE/PaaK family acyltransferase n=1 Tax=unclassified Croceitalea TaxID=2632280 RepID=UPI0030D75B66